MIKYIQNKKINFSLLKKNLEKSHETNQFTNMGCAKRELELILEDILNISSDKAVVCVSNGTLALHAIYLYFKEKNIKWVSPSFTFPSCIVGGFECDIVDIDETYTMKLNEENLKKYDGFIITNLFGTYPENINEWISACKENKKILIFDNASSPLSTVNGVNICNLGDFSFGSLHHTKSLGFGEGGFLVCNKDLYNEFNRILGFGFKYKNNERVYSVNSSNFKMSDVTAASILQHIQTYDLNKHLKLQELYVKKIKKMKGVSLFNYNEEVIYGNLPIVFDKPISKDKFLEKGIEAQKYYKPLDSSKESNELYDRIINLPLHIGLRTKDVNYICKILKDILKQEEK